MITQLLYESVATDAMSLEEFERIEATALVYNALNAITGMCCYDGQRFMQLIEGKHDAVDKLFSRIDKDGRHEQLNTLHHGTAEYRAFGEWQMRCVLVPAASDERREAIEQLLPPSLSSTLVNLMLSFGERSLA